MPNIWERIRGIQEQERIAREQQEGPRRERERQLEDQRQREEAERKRQYDIETAQQLRILEESGAIDALREIQEGLPEGTTRLGILSAPHDSTVQLIYNARFDRMGNHLLSGFFDYSVTVEAIGENAFFVNGVVIRREELDQNSELLQEKIAHAFTHPREIPPSTEAPTPYRGNDAEH